jgi:pre-mRNA-processing factor 40
MEERESAFIGILKELEITADTTWDDVLHLIISHPNYRCLRSLAQRKLAFATFMESKRRVGTDEIKRRFEKNRLEFVKVLERRREVSFESSWR